MAAEVGSVQPGQEPVLRHGGDDGGFVFTREFVKSVHGSWGASEDRFVGKITLNVSSKSAGGFIATRAVFFEGFHDDPVQLAT